jgi:TPR repeat protein
MLIQCRRPIRTHHRQKNSPKAVNNRKSQRDPDTVDEAKLKRQLIKESIFYLKKLSDKGYAEAQYLLGDAYSSGAVGKTENKEAFLLFVHAAKHGHVESAYRTSHCYEEGLGTGRDARKSVEYLKIAAAKNHAAAMYKLGVYSFYGRMGLPSNTDTQKMGIKWLTRASNIATELIAAAPYELGKIYFNGFKDIVIPDKKYALELYSQAAALGHIQSAAILGQMYETGDIVPQDGNLSIHYYTQAALGGDPESMLAMCAWYLVGCDPHLPKDDNEAFEWAKRAAQCNLARAQFALANFYEKGIGCIKNVTEAQTWYLRAAENGDAKALERITDSKLVAKLKKKNSFVTSDKGMADAKEKDCVIM